MKRVGEKLYGEGWVNWVVV